MSGETPVLALDAVGQTFTRGAPVLDAVSLQVFRHDFLSVIGSSGCGKTTLLRIMAGLQRPSSGTVRLSGELVTGPRREVCLVFQDYAATLLPWRTALENTVFGLRAKDAAERRRHREAALELLERMRLLGAADCYPWELSGGMQQRVALARALIRTPTALLLDEPFSAVDEQTRGSLQELLLRIHGEESCAIVLVSHHLEDVVTLSRRIVVLRGQPSRAHELSVAAPLTRRALRSQLVAEEDAP